MPFSELFAASMDLLMLVLNSISPYFSLSVSIAVLLTFVRSTIVGSTPMRFSFGLVFALTSCVSASRDCKPSILNFCVCTGISTLSAAVRALIRSVPRDGRQSISTKSYAPITSSVSILRRICSFEIIVTMSVSALARLMSAGM